MRAPQIVAYAAVPGAALLVSPAGVVVLSAGHVAVDLAQIARAAGGIGAKQPVASFLIGAMCVHTACICNGWRLCVLSSKGANPAPFIERLRRASYVLGLALIDGVAPNGPGDAGSGGAPAEVVANTRSLGPTN